MRQHNIRGARCGSSTRHRLLQQLRSSPVVTGSFEAEQRADDDHYRPSNPLWRSRDRERHFHRHLGLSEEALMDCELNQIWYIHSLPWRRVKSAQVEAAKRRDRDEEQQIPAPRSR